MMRSLKLFAWGIAVLAFSGTLPEVHAALSLNSAEFVHGYTVLLLRFNSKAREFAENGTDVPACDAILETATVQKIGTLPSCQWFMEGQVLQVLLGEEPSIALGDVVSTLPSALAAKDEDPLVAAGALTASVTSTLTFITPEASLEIWPPQAKPCSALIVSAARSIGAAGRKFTVSWSFGAVDVATTALEVDLARASLYNSLKFRIPGSTLSSAVSSSSATSVQLEIKVQITNWLGLSHTTSAIVTVDLSGAAVPLVYPTSLLNRTIQSNQAVTFSVMTRYADESACGTAISIPDALSESWSYLNSSSWLPLESVLSTDTAREPWKVDLPAYSFEPGSSHQLKVSASYGSGTVREEVFSLEVSAALPPIIRISGPYEVSETCSFTLDASMTYDPVAPSNADVDFYWSCASGTGSFDCRTLSNFGPQTWVLKNGTGSSGPLLIVNGNQLLEGNYTFTLQAIRLSDRSVGSSTWTVDVIKTASISISLGPLWYEGQSFSTQANTYSQISSTALLRTGHGCGDKEAFWLWALVEADSPFNILTYLDSPSNETEIVYTANELLYDYLLPSQRYSLALVEQTAQTSPSSLVQADALGLSFSRTVSFLADAPPAGGSIACIPMLGEAASTEFFLTSSEWHDEDVSNLSFAFYIFPLPAGVSLADDQVGGVTMTGTFIPPEVEWKNTSSENHWQLLGGRCLGYSQSPLQLRLPAGQHMLAVVVEDSLGAVASSFMAGPLVTASTSTATVEDGLSIALVSNNAEIILSMLDATITEDVDITKEVQAFTTAAAVADLSETGLCRLSRVANSLLRNATPATARSISQAFSIVLADLAKMPSVGVNRLVSVVFSVSASYATAELDEVLLRSEQLTTLAMELGNAILATVPLHGSQNLSSVDESGRGLQVYVVKKRALDLPYDGISVGGLRMPAYAFQSDDLIHYLLQVGPACSSVEVQLTTWLKSNPYAWANATSYTATLVTADATIVVLEMRHCASLEILNLTNRKLTLSLPLPDMPMESAPEGYVYEATCAVFDPDILQWTREGVRSKQLLETVECEVASGSGPTIPFTVFYMRVPIPEIEETVNVGIMVVAILVFFLCLGAVAYSNSKKGADKVEPEDSPEEGERGVASTTLEEADPIPAEPHAETIPKGADAEVSIPVEPHAETIPKGADAEAIEHFKDFDKEVSPKTSSSAAGPGPPEVPAPGQSGQTVEVCIDPSSQSSLPRNPEDLPGQPDVDV